MTQANSPLLFVLPSVASQMIWITAHGNGGGSNAVFFEPSVLRVSEKIDLFSILNNFDKVFRSMRHYSCIIYLK